jgi:hypothetical protein
LALGLRFVSNPYRRRWAFPLEELAFFEAAIRSARQSIGTATCPPVREIEEARMNLATGGWLIERRLTGIPELRRAERIEHFGQAAHLERLTWDEVLPHGVGRTFITDRTLQPR